jgi:glycosyltransferase involved in cell wall biosynthesis
LLLRTDWNELKVKRNTDFVILNDLHPDYQPGAATIAFETSQVLGSRYKVEFWCTSHGNITGIGYANGNVQIRACQTRPWFDGFLKKRSYLMAYAEFLNFHRLLWLAINLLRVRPRVLWMHQIGNRFPRSVILVARLLKIKTIVTLHDFSLVAPGKIYPADLEIDGIRGEDSWESKLVGAFPKPGMNKGRLFSKFFRLRRLLLKYLLNRVDVVFTISQMQKSILGLFGFSDSEVLPNGIAPCGCLLDDKNIQGDGSVRILFAGRSIGKGLERLVKTISKTCSVKLVLAGDSTINDIASMTLPEDQIEYMGVISRSEILKVIHSVDLVAVLSECFDVFPTITLEAIAHGTSVITTKNTGNAAFSAQTEGIKCIAHDENDESLLHFIQGLVDKKSSRVEIKNPFSTPQKQVESALEILELKLGLGDFLQRNNG